MSIAAELLPEAREPPHGLEVDAVVRSILARYGAEVPEPEVRRRVEHEFRRYAEARVRPFISILVERAVRSSLPRPRADPALDRSTRGDETRDARPDHTKRHRAEQIILELG